MAEPAATNGAHAVQFVLPSTVARTPAEAGKSPRREALTRSASQTFTSLANLEQKQPSAIEAGKKIETVQSNKALSTQKRSSMRLSRVGLNQIMNLKPITSNVATPNNIGQVANEKMDVFVKESKKERSLLGSLTGARQIKKTRTFDLVSNAKFFAAGGTVLAYRVSSEENPSKNIVMKLAKGGAEKSQELNRDVMAIKRLNKGKKARGIHSSPYETRVLSKEGRDQILAKTPGNANDVHTTAIIVEEYTHDLAHTMQHMRYEDQVLAAEDLFAGMEKMFEEGALNLDLKPGNVLVKLRDGKFERADFSDFGSAYFTDEIKQNPHLLNKLVYTNAYISDQTLHPFTQACNKIIPEPTTKEEVRANQKNTTEAIDLAQKSMKFSFGLVLFSLFTAKNESTKGPFVVDRMILDPKTNEEKKTTISSETLGGFVRLDSEGEDIGPIRFNREAFPEVPGKMVGVIEELLNPTSEKSFKEIHREFKAFAKTVPR